MSLQAFDAASAYAQSLSRPLSGGAGGAGEADKAGEGAFAALVDTAFSQAVNTNRAAEAKASEMVAGKADLVDVVSAVNAAETALETMVAVRDRMVNAYQEILRMPI